MTFKYTDEIDRLKPLSFSLSILKLDSAHYTAMLYQHCGVLATDPFRNDKSVSKHFTSLFELAKQECADLLLTPEYSCPWEAVRSLLDDTKLQPDNEKLWVLGCESISIAELKQLQNDYEAKNNLIVYFEEDIFSRTGEFLDPVCYIYKVRENDIDKLLLLIQFKTNQMSEWGEINEAKMIRGEQIYILRNKTRDPSEDDVNLFTLICSDVMEFSYTQVTHWTHRPFLILNPQCNPEPQHANFSKFREDVMRQHKYKEIVSLNWAKDSELKNGTSFIKYSRSNIQFKADTIHFFPYRDDLKFLDNHSKGMYYVFMPPDTHVYYLNNDSFCFLYSNQKNGCNALPSYKQSGPRIQKLFKLDLISSFIEVNAIDDSLTSFLSEINSQNVVLKNKNIDPLDKERLVNLTIGVIKISPPIDWYRIDKLASFSLNKDEIIKRLTIVYDDVSYTDRVKYVTSLREIEENILPNTSLWPSQFNEFAGNSKKIQFEKNGKKYDYIYNLHTVDNNSHATVAFVGENENFAQQALSTLEKLFEEDEQKRVIVWCKDTCNNYRYFHSGKPEINSDPFQGRDDISNGDT